MPIQPLRDLLLVEPIPEESVRKSKTGLIIAVYERQSALLRNIFPFRAKVLAKGKDVKIPVNVGDTVVFSRFGATRVFEENEKKELFILPESDVEAKVEA